MKKVQLLPFIPKPEEKYKSTHQIAQVAKQNYYIVLALLTELEHLPRPLVKKVQFGKTRMHRLWKQTKLEKNQVESFLKIRPEERGSNEHLVILRDRWWGDMHLYINSIIEATKSEMVHPEVITKIK